MLNTKTMTQKRQSISFTVEINDLIEQKNDKNKSPRVKKTEVKKKEDNVTPSKVKVRNSPLNNKLDQIKDMFDKKKQIKNRK